MTMVKWVLLRKSGAIEYDEGEVAAVPSVGDGHFHNDIGCRVVGDVFTPHLPNERHVFLVEEVG